MVCVILPEMSLLVYMYMTTGGQQERGIEGGREGGGREGEGGRGEGDSEGGSRVRQERKKGRREG